MLITKKHRKPVDSTPSTFLVDMLKIYAADDKSIPVLDLPCGFGRNALFLHEQGYKVVCADYDDSVFNNHWFDINKHQLQPIILDAMSQLAFAAQSFSLITTIHFYTDGLFEKLHRILRCGGIVIFESFGGQGENWRGLPNQESFKESLQGSFDILYYKERLVGPTKSNITVKMVARKIG